MSVGASRAIGRLIDNQKTGAAQTDAIRSPDKNGKTDGSNSSLTAAIDQIGSPSLPFNWRYIRNAEIRIIGRRCKSQEIAVIDKMSVGASRAIGRLIDNQKTGAAQTDAIRSPDKNGKTDGSNSSLTAAIDHMVQQGMPVDVEHITSIRQAIAEGK